MPGKKPTVWKFNLLLLVGCASKPQVVQANLSSKEPIQVEIINNKPQCYLPEQPDPPQAPEWPDGSEDYERRIYVHRRDYDLLFQHVLDSYHYQTLLIECAKQLSEWQP